MAPMTQEHLDGVAATIDAFSMSQHNAPTRIVDAEDGIVVCEPQRRSVVIMAFGPTSRFVSQFQHDPEWEIWGLNNGYYHDTAYDGLRSLRIDRWFEIHEMKAQPQDDLIWMQKCPVPLYVANLAETRKYGSMPNAVQFPRQRLEQKFGIMAPWWACTFAYQIALAMAEGFTRIALLGMEFGSPREWIMERPNVLWWAGFAAGHGVQILMPQDSSFMEHPYAYGMDYDNEKRWCDLRTHDLITQWGYARTPQGETQLAAYEQGLKDALPR